MMLSNVIGVFIKLFFLFTPFFVLSMFIAMTRSLSTHERRMVVNKTTVAVWISSLLIYFGGNWAFGTIGITIDAFRIGTGVILMISAIELVLGKNKGGELPDGEHGDITVVPLAIPYTLGPGTIGALLVMGGENAELAAKTEHLAGITAAVIALGILLSASVGIERIIGKRGICILSKITGLVLASIAAQVIFTGIKNFLFK
ncbi:MAG: MarC family protein [Victivallaceae bacterium]|nr:MarC family protein [Victivallaceae bacterium]